MPCKRGRPKLPPSQKLSWTGKVRRTMLDGAELEARAAAEGLSVSAFLGELVSEALAARMDAERRNGERERVARLRLAAADAATARVVALAPPRPPPSRAARANGARLGTGPGVARAGIELERFAARESGPPEALAVGAEDFFGPRKSTPPEPGTLRARDPKRKPPETAISEGLPTTAQNISQNR